MSHPSHPSDPLTLTNPRGGRSHFAAGAQLTGDLSVPGHIELLGHLDGRISADSILIEEGGSAIGELRANTVTIKGSFEGIITGGNVELHTSAKVSGEIFYRSLSVDSGAELNATCSRRASSDDKTSGSVS